MNGRPIVLPLSDTSATLELAGGKGANLGELLRGGFPVPAGFTVTTAAYDRVAPETVPDLLESAPDGSAVRDHIEKCEIPAEIADAVRAAYRDLGGPVAVRSSATAEDLPDAAFAGQQDTYLNIIGEDAVLDAVRRCWASLWTERAIAYRRKQNVDEATMAVVVQRLVPAEFAGVMFTANPVTGARDEIVVDANEGLGESVVSGMVTPDHYVLRKGKVKDVKRGRRELTVRPLADGGTEEVASTAGRELPQEALKSLAKLGKSIGKHFGAPQDIEWAWAEGKVQIVQSRPITALPEPPSKREAQAKRPVSMTELLPIRPYPLDVTTWTGALFEAVHESLRLAGDVPEVDEVKTEEDGVLVRWELPLPKPSAKTLPKVIGLMVHYDPREFWEDAELKRFVEQMREIDRRDVTALDWAGLRATLDEALTAPAVVFGLRGQYMTRTFMGVAWTYLVLAMMGEKDRLNDLYAATGAITMEINEAIESLVARIRGDARLTEIFEANEPAGVLAAIGPDPFAAEFQDFLDRYGCRETVSPALASQPTWSAAPEVVLGLVKSFALHERPPRGESPAAVLRKRAHDRKIPPFAGRAVDLMALYGRILEDTHFYLTLPLPTIRRIMLEFGRRLAGDDLIDAPEDVLHLRLDEVEPVPGRREIVERRKAKRDALGDAPWVDPDEMPDVEVPEDALLSGMPGGVGVAEGPARIIHGPEEFDRLRTGDVLIAPFTHPAWTPLFQRAAAVVVDTGGPASHAAIVAREYAIPAVMGTGDGTSSLKDGQLVRVDGTRGVVLPVD